MKYFSQFGEDRILAKYFAGKKDGVCVEIGANDGINDSTTFYFEKLGWTCLLVEPNPALCEKIRSSRTATLVECAASDRSGQASLFIAQGAPRAHGVSTIHGGEAAKKKIQSYGFSSREVNVVTKTLDEILMACRFPSEIDFISIDVEGHELAVLQGLSLDRWKPKILLIEDNSNFEDQSVRKYLKSHRYVPFLRTGVNDWYASVDSRKFAGWQRRTKYMLDYLLVRLKGRLKRISAVIWLWRAMQKLRT